MDKNFKILIAAVFFLALAVYADDYFFKKIAETREEKKSQPFLIRGAGDFNRSRGGDLSRGESFQGAALKINVSETLAKKTFASSVAEKNNNVLEAKGVYVFNLTKNKEIFLKNPERRLPLASVAKLMTAVIALQNTADDSIITVSGKAIKQEGDSGFVAGEKWRLYDLIDVMLVSSSNDAAYAVFEAVEKNLNDNAIKENFVGLMNAKAKDLKMFKTVFYNATGLDINETKAGAYGSPKDIAVLMEYILEKYPRIFLKTKEKIITAGSLNGSSRDFYNTNTLLGKISGIEGGKTGFTNLSGGNLVFVFEKTPQEKFIIVILGSTYDGRFYDAKRIIDVLADIKI